MQHLVLHIVFSSYYFLADWLFCISIGKTVSFAFFKKDFIYFIFRGEGREKERARNINVCLPLANSQLGTWPGTQACALTGNQTGNPLVPRPALSPQSHNMQGSSGFLIPQIKFYWWQLPGHLLLNKCQAFDSLIEVSLWHLIPQPHIHQPLQHPEYYLLFPLMVTI